MASLVEQTLHLKSFLISQTQKIKELQKYKFENLHLKKTIEA